MMENEDVIVFLGPTLKIDDACRLVHADYRPPASRGDIYRATKSDPRIILLIDGAFEAEAAVLHNEILWAISKGVTVFGAASMGALRAAELASFGMVGIGKLFEAYRDGNLERDDAVAVVHGPAELGYPLLSTALVDIWSTLDMATEAGVMSSCERDSLSNIASKIFYKRLSLATLLETAVQLDFPQERAEVLRQHVASQGMFSQKRADAIRALEAIDGEIVSSTSGSEFVFERTSAWEKLVAELEEKDAPTTMDSSAYVDETELAIIGLLLAEREAQRRGFVLGRTEFEDAARSFRLRNKLNRSSEVEQWMEIAQLGHDDYVKLVEGEFFLSHSRGLARNRLRDLVSRAHSHKRSALALTRKS